MLMLQISRIWPNQPVRYCKCVRSENQSSQLRKSQDARHSTVTDRHPTEDLQAITSWPTATDHKYQLVQDVLYCKQNGQTAVLKPMLPSFIQEKVTEYMHNSSGHSRIDKCIHQIKWECHIPNLAHTLNKSVTCCNTCEEVEHLNRLYDMEHRSHLPSKPEELCAIDL